MDTDFSYVPNHQLSTLNLQPVSTGFSQTSAIHDAMMNAELTMPDFRRTLAAWQTILSTIGTDTF